MGRRESGGRGAEKRERRTVDEFQVPAAAIFRHLFRVCVCLCEKVGRIECIKVRELGREREKNKNNLLTKPGRMPGNGCGGGRIGRIVLSICSATIVCVFVCVFVCSLQSYVCLYVRAVCL